MVKMRSEGPQPQRRMFRDVTEQTAKMPSEVCAPTAACLG